MSKALIVGALLALGATAADAAQRKQYGRPVETPESRMHAAVRGFAYCSMSKDESRVRDLLASEIGSKQEAQIAKKLQAPARGCIDPTWPDLSPALVRGALAENLYRREFGRKVFEKPATQPPLPDTFAVVPDDRNGTDEQKNDWYLAAISNCAVFVQPELAHELLLIPPDVPEEGEAFDQLRPAYSQCSGGKDFKLPAGIIRRFLSESLLRWSRKYRAGGADAG